MYSVSLSQLSCHDLMTMGYCSPPFGFKVKQFRFSSILADSLTDKLQLLHELFLVPASYILDGVAYLMYDTMLHYGARKDASDGIRKTFQSIHTSYQNVLYTTVLEVGQHTEPKVCTFIPGYVHAQQILMPFRINTQHIINGTSDGIATIIGYLVMDGIHPDYWINGFKGT